MVPRLVAPVPPPVGADLLARLAAGLSPPGWRRTARSAGRLGARTPAWPMTPSAAHWPHGEIRLGGPDRRAAPGRGLLRGAARRRLCRRWVGTSAALGPVPSPPAARAGADDRPPAATWGRLSRSCAQRRARRLQERLRLSGRRAGRAGSMLVIVSRSLIRAHRQLGGAEEPRHARATGPGRAGRRRAGWSPFAQSKPWPSPSGSQLPGGPSPPPSRPGVVAA